MSSLRFFAPKLALAVKEIAQLHGDKGRVSLRSGTSWIVDLLEELANSPKPRHAAIIARLTDPELRALINHSRHLCGEPLFDVVLEAVATRPRKAVAEGLWGLVGPLVEEEGLLGVLRSTVSNPAWQDLYPGGLLDLRESLDSVDVIVSRLTNGWRKGDKKFVGYVQELVPLSPRTESRDWESLSLGKKMLRRGLTGKWTGMIRSEEARDLLRWAHELLGPADYRVFAVNYVMALESDSWAEVIILDLVKKLGDPRVKPENWTGLSEEKRNALARWINTHKLSEFFLEGAGDEERFDFWKKFVNDMGPASEGRVRAGQGFFEFPGFGVVEFMEKGNAAYIYEPDVYAKFRSRRNVSNYELKDRSLVMSDYLGLRAAGSSSEMRIIHQPGWQTDWSAVVAGYIRSGRGERPAPRRNPDQPPRRKPRERTSWRSLILGD